ncbi:MAG: prephenate dehydrogenase/arogenate dehydrogenase family protein, partial [Anaerolineae bacterium]|nr:prephenate dehydrogenase/arogenate dehydrogenase family protein [Anaerolineae bacterium]
DMASKPCITIIGMGLIGTSIGLAIRNARGDEIQIVGHDKEQGVAGAAKRMGAVHKVERNLFSACSEADMIVLAIPASGVKETLELVANDLKSGCVITDTASLKVPVLKWADQFLPEDVSFVGGDPILFGDDAGIESARADLFEKKLYCIVPSPRASSDAVKLVTDLAAMLGAIPHYIDPYEHDGLIGGTEHIADILAVVLLGSLSSSNGWHDMRRLCGATFDRVTCFSASDPAEYRDRALLNSDNVVRWIDAVQEELFNFRTLIKRGDADVIENYYQTQMDVRKKWLEDQATQIWDKKADSADIPKAGEFFGQMLFGGLGRRRES